MSDIISITREENRWVLTFRIDLLGPNYSKIKRLLERPIAQVDKTNDWEGLTLDLNEVNLFDSAGMGLIVTLYKKYSKQGKTFNVINCSDFVHSVFQSGRLDDILNVTKKPRN